MALYIGNTRYCPVIGKAETLPYDAEIEYLQGDGASYIDTGIIDNGQYSINMSISVVWNNSSTQYTFLYGYSSGWSSKSRVVRTQGNDLYLWYNNTEKILTGITQTILTIESTPTSFKVNGLELWSRSSASIDNALNVYLFARNATGSPNWGDNTEGKVSLKYYNCKIYNGNTLLINLIPVRVGTVGCMYDKISGNLFYNQGTGNFTLGPDVT